jgi:hypothetical protein
MPVMEKVVCYSEILHSFFYSALPAEVPQKNVRRIVRRLRRLAQTGEQTPAQQCVEWDHRVRLSVWGGDNHDHRISSLQPTFSMPLEERIIEIVAHSRRFWCCHSASRIRRSQSYGDRL